MLYPGSMDVPSDIVILLYNIFAKLDERLSHELVTHGLELTLCFSASVGERTLVEDFFELWTQSWGRSMTLRRVRNMIAAASLEKRCPTPKRKWKRSSVCGEGMADKCYLCWIWCGAYVAGVDEKTSMSSLVKATLWNNSPTLMLSSPQLGETIPE